MKQRPWAQLFSENVLLGEPLGQMREVRYFHYFYPYTPYSYYQPNVTLNEMINHFLFCEVIVNVCETNRAQGLEKKKRMMIVTIMKIMTKKRRVKM